MFAALGLLSSVVSGIGSIAAGQGQAASAALNAENIETQKIMNQAISLQRANDRQREFFLASSANNAILAMMGRDTGGGDRSVDAFLRRNRETVQRDVRRINVQSRMESLQLDLQAASERRRGQDAAMAGLIEGFSTIITGVLNYENTRASPSYTGTSSSLAPSTPPIPPPNPFL